MASFFGAGVVSRTFGLVVIAVAAGSAGMAVADESATDPETVAQADVEEAPASEPATAEEPESPVAAESAAITESVDQGSSSEAVAEPAVPSARRIRIKLDATGEIFAPAGRDVPPVRRPIGVDARFDFVESGRDGGEDVERRYLDAAADVRIDDASQATRLPADARRLRVVIRGATPMPYLETGCLTREELDLLDTPFDPLLLERLLPESLVTVGDTWQVKADAVAGLLAIDTVESGGIDARLDDVAEGRATVALSGLVDGAADGVPTHVTLDGTYTIEAEAVDGRVRLSGSTSALSAKLAERREASHVAPGFDIEARITVASSAAEWSRGSDAIEPSVRAGGPGRPGAVWHHDRAGRYDIVHDARWRVIEDGPDGLVMRLLDHGALVAQCSITSLPPTPSQSPPSIAEVERDLERSLAGQFGRLEHSSEASRSDGVRLVRVAAGGRADGLAFRWIHHVLTDEAGHRLAVTCTLEESQSKRFGEADRELVDGVSFPDGGRGRGEAAGEGTAAQGRQARLPKESRTP